MKKETKLDFIFIISCLIMFSLSSCGLIILIDNILKIIH